MAKNSITDYDNTAANNTDVQSVDISEGCSPSGINNAIREVMADLADVNDGTVALTSPKFDSIKDGNIKPPDASGTDVAGTATTIKGGAGTGTGAGGSIVFQTADGGSTGSSVNAHATAMTITDDGSIDINGNDLILDADADTKLYASTDDVVKMNIAGSEMFRFDSDGLKFNGDTAAANALDDYEEGTWTPTIDYGTISVSYASYTKIGNTVHLRASISSFSDRSTASAVNIGGLPYASASNSKTSQGILGRYINSGGDALVVYLGQNSSTLAFFTTNQTSDYVRVNHNHLSSNSSNLFITISYIG